MSKYKVFQIKAFGKPPSYEVKETAGAYAPSWLTFFELQHAIQACDQLNAPPPLPTVVRQVYPNE